MQESACQEITAKFLITTIFHSKMIKFRKKLIILHATTSMPTNELIVKLKLPSQGSAHSACNKDHQV
jgi:hypothetical protein